MKVESKNPSEDPPNQEKNQYLTVYWWEKWALNTKSKEGLNQEMADLWEEGNLKRQKSKTVGMKIRQPV